MGNVLDGSQPFCARSNSTCRSTHFEHTLFIVTDSRCCLPYYFLNAPRKSGSPLYRKNYNYMSSRIYDKWFYTESQIITRNISMIIQRQKWQYQSPTGSTPCNDGSQEMWQAFASHRSHISTTSPSSV